MTPRPACSRPTASAWITEASREEQQAARFHWESDRRRLRTMVAGVLCAGFFVALVLGVVGLRVQQVRLSYRLDGLRTIKGELEEARGRLRVELATLKSLARIEGKARTELGMVLPARDQIRLAREFVGGPASGLEALERRAAIAERPALPEPGVR